MNKSIENKGITLVALVITIIVLLILAGVSISLVVGDNGILTQSKTSSEATKIGQMQEALQIAASDVQTAYFGKSATDANSTFDSEVNYGTLATALDSQGYKLLIKGGADDKKVASGNIPFPESTDTAACFYVSNGKTGISVRIKKSPGGMALIIEYEKTNNKIEMSDATPVGGELTQTEPNVILHADYVTGYTLVEIKGSSSGTKYAYDGNPMYYVERDVNNNYGSYCWVIEGTTTTDVARTKVTETNSAAGIIDKSTFIGRYDINGNGVLQGVDVTRANAIALGHSGSMLEVLKSDVNSDYYVNTDDDDSTYDDVSEVKQFQLRKLFKITPSTTEATNQSVTGTVEMNYLCLQAATVKAGFGTTLEEAKTNATEISAMTTTLTATTNGYFYAVAEDSAGEKVETNYQVTNIN